MFGVFIYLSSQIVFSMFVMTVPLTFLVPKEQLEKYKDLIYGGGLILCIFIFIPFVFYFISQLTGLLQVETKLELYLKNLREKKE